MKENSKISKIARAMDLPADVLKTTPHIEISGNNEILAQGYLGILSFDTEQITLSAGKYSLKISGYNLFIRNFTVDAVLISGTVTHLEFI